jgi:putative sigma-54 modulation protein
VRSQAGCRLPVESLEDTMAITVTSRHFKAHPSLVEYAEQAVEGLGRYYDGIIKGEVILEFERTHNSVKIAEVNLSVFNAQLTATHQSDDFFKSIDGAMEKMASQLKKYKDKLHSKDRDAVRKVREKE